MIRSFKHKGLRAFYETGSPRGIRVDHAARLSRMLQFMDRATVPADLDLPGWRLHPLKGDLSGYWSLSVSGNWRVIFRFADPDIELIDYLDDHRQEAGPCPCTTRHILAKRF
ncbi:type II toxin-antitoxin system RelE/ParE family toxin [Pseudomonas sp. COR58]|uniref:Type II toxin-antitoxin system RelE/ParE family toxin n=1 Tax=Pseudomonas ekonensis TaxID=2842353 RepID=A0ABS6P7W4_9PSED|nr:type II toxin-antitoxin system RelE/ParE family toxin [Pseudomonas ekonensis]